MNRNHSSAVFSPDGKEVYWRDMSQKSLLFMEEVQGTWTLPRKVPFGSFFYRMDVPFFSADGNRLYFLSNRPFWRKERIYYVERQGRGWSSWKSVGPSIDDYELHWQFSIASNGTLYFAGSRDGGPWYIYRSRPTGDGYGTPEMMPPEINAIDTREGYAQISPFIAEDESFLLFSSHRPDDVVGGGINLYISYARPDGTWTEPINVTRHLDLPGSDLCPILSPDKKYLFFLTGQVSWVPATFVEELRPR